MNMFIIQGEWFLGYCAWDYQGVKPVQGRGRGQHLGKPAAVPWFPKNSKWELQPTVCNAEHLGVRLRLKG